MKNNMAGVKKKKEKSARNEKNNSFKWRWVFMFIWIVVYVKMWKKYFEWGFIGVIIYIKKGAVSWIFFYPYGPRLTLKMDWWSKGLNIGWKLLLIMILLSEGPFFFIK